MANKASPTYARSELLSNEENTIIREMYAPKQEVMSCTVAQLFQAAPNPRVWTKKNTGVACVVKDHNQRSYFIHVVNIDTHTVVHSEEFYLEMDYRTPYPYFHTFSGEKCMVGLNFCHDGEAQLFLDAVNGIINRNKKRKEKIDAQNRPPPAAVMPPPTTNNIPVPEPVAPLSKKDKKKKDKKKDKKKKGISKADISGPSNFKHLSHLGWDETKNSFDDSQAHPLFKQLLTAAGVKANELDESTAQFITGFVDQMGGIETLEKPAPKPSGRPPPPAPPSKGGPPSNRGAPPPPPGPRAGGRAPPPTRNDRGPPPPAPHRQGPPPPPPNNRGAPPPPPVHRGAAPAAPRAPPAPAAPAAPPAPRAPPAPAPPRAPAAPAMAKVAPGAPPPPPGKGNLLDEIRRGKQLTSAANNPLPAAPAAGGGNGGDLMSAIRGFGGARGGLKAADNRPEPEPEDKLEGMAGALARALAERNKHLAVDSDKSDSESDDDWSD